MSKLTMTTDEQKNIDSQVEQMMDWVNSRKVEAEQLALDSARLLACTSNRLDKIKNQSFFKRCWNRFTGKTGEMERANISDMIEMQKKAFRYINMLQEQQVLMAHSLLSLKNNLVALAVSEIETRDMIGLLAQKTLERFDALETRTDQLEISTNLQGWLLGLEEREYDKKYPTQFMRMFRIINDFYNIKKDNWNYNDLMFMRTALRKVDIDPKIQLSLSEFIDNLTDEIQSQQVGLINYTQAIEAYAPANAIDYSQFVIDNISSPVVVTVHGLKKQFSQTSEIVEVLQDELSISAIDAQKRILRRIISGMNVNMEHRFSLGETAIEIMGCLRLIDNLDIPVIQDENNTNNDTIELESEKHDFSNVNKYMKQLQIIEQQITKTNLLRLEKVTYFLDVNTKNLDTESKQNIKRDFLIGELKKSFDAINPIRVNLEKEIEKANELMSKVCMKRKVKKLPEKPEININLDSKSSRPNNYGTSIYKWEHAFDDEAQILLGYVSMMQQSIEDMSELFQI